MNRLLLAAAAFVVFFAAAYMVAAFGYLNLDARAWPPVTRAFIMGASVWVGFFVYLAAG